MRRGEIDRQARRKSRYCNGGVFGNRRSDGRGARGGRGNAPYGERDVGALEFKEVRFFWKIDYYDLEMESHSPNRADPAVTARILVLMRSEEY